MIDIRTRTNTNFVANDFEIGIRSRVAVCVDQFVSEGLTSIVIHSSQHSSDTSCSSSFADWRQCCLYVMWCLVDVNDIDRDQIDVTQPRRIGRLDIDGIGRGQVEVQVCAALDSQIITRPICNQFEIGICYRIAIDIGDLHNVSITRINVRGDERADCLACNRRFRNDEGVGNGFQADII